MLGIPHEIQPPFCWHEIRRAAILIRELRKTTCTRAWLRPRRSRLTPMYGPAVRCKKTSPSGGCAVLH
jgi:hypothetical protein